MHISWLQLINYHSIFFHDTTWMLDVPRVGKRRKNSTKSSPHLDRRSRKHGKPCAYIILRTSPPHAVKLSPYFSASVRHLALVDLTRTNYWLALCDVATSYYYGCWLYYYGTNTPRSESKTIYKLSLWHAYANVPFITYNKSSTHNDNVDTCWIIDYFQQNILVNTEVFITQQITSNEMNFSSTNPQRWKRLLWTIGKPMGRAIYSQYRDQRSTDHPGWSGLYQDTYGDSQGREP